jgi:hypothetical protein
LLKGWLPKRIVITGIDHRAYNGVSIGALILESLDTAVDPVAFGGTKISGIGNVVLPLKRDNQLALDWNGSGEFYIVLLLPDSNAKGSGIKEGNLWKLRSNRRFANRRFAFPEVPRINLYKWHNAGSVWS